MTDQYDDDEDFDTGVEVPVQPDDDEFDIEVVPTEFSQGEKDAGRPVADLSEEESPEPTDDELAQYDARVAKRIKAAHAQANANRRAAEAAEKRAAEATRIAAAMRDELVKARQSGTGYARVAVKSTRDSLRSQREALEVEYRTAIESGDAEAQVKAQQKLTLVTQQLGGLPDDETLERDLAEHLNRPVPEVPQAAPQVDAYVETWKRQNPWFDQDEVLRNAAIQAENLLVQNYNKPAGAKATLDQVSAMLRPLLEERGLLQAPPPPPAPPVPKPRAPSPAMPVVRRMAGGKQKVQLTPEMIDLASELGLSPQEYAREYVRLQGATQ